MAVGNGASLSERGRRIAASPQQKSLVPIHRNPVCIQAGFLVWPADVCRPCLSTFLWGLKTQGPTLVTLIAEELARRQFQLPRVFVLPRTASSMFKRLQSAWRPPTRRVRNSLVAAAGVPVSPIISWRTAGVPPRFRTALTDRFVAVRVRPSPPTLDRRRSFTRSRTGGHPKYVASLAIFEPFGNLGRLTAFRKAFVKDSGPFT